MLSDLCVSHFIILRIYFTYLTPMYPVECFKGVFPIKKLGVYDVVLPPLVVASRRKEGVYLKVNFLTKKIKKMEASSINLFILDSDRIAVMKLRLYLYRRFGRYVNIASFYQKELCLKRVNKLTNLVILGSHITMGIKNDIKSINPLTEVINYTNPDDMGQQIEDYKTASQTTDNNIGSRLGTVVPFYYRAIPKRILDSDFSLGRYLAIYLFVFVLMGVITLFILRRLVY